MKDQSQNTPSELVRICEALIFAADKPLSLERMRALVDEAAAGDDSAVDLPALKAAIAELQCHYQGRGVELVKVGSGYRFQTCTGVSDVVNRLWDEKPQKYSRALLETLALVAYRQPITRGDIEEIRGVSVSSNIIKTLVEREWIRVIGHRDVPGRPAIYATTKVFLDYFNLHSLDQLPALADVRDIDTISREIAQQLELEDTQEPEAQDSGEKETTGESPALGTLN
ncbi:MAG: SMC-Scp complex subunit ScpB [Oleiphilus sp.]|nr:MAG: SMC-Scp complex subunit ScpB [Oleiphilus sp.]